VNPRESGDSWPKVSPRATALTVRRSRESVRGREARLGR
jgi:hypothetical protein